MNRKNYNAIDLTKFIFAFIVILVHTYPFYESYETIGFISSNIIGRIVIPFYLVCAGYFFQLGLSTNNENYYKRYIKKLIKLYLIWSIITIPAGMLLLSKFIDVNPLTGISGLIIGFIYSGTYYHLWYMAALIFSIIILYHLNKRFRLRTLLIITFILYIIGLTETYYYLLVHLGINHLIEPYFNLFITTRNGLFFGLLFVCIGMTLAKYPCKIKYLKTNIIIFTVLLFIEAFIVKNYNLALDYNMYLSNVPLIYFLVSYLLKLDINYNLDYKKLRNYSTLMYFSHGMFLEYIPFIFNIYNEHGLFRISSVLICTLLTSIIIYKKNLKIY